ncbi:MAG: hypothetical protein M1814_003569 [Vezdaea aestivalis]|nr:MAG: hypothetical protein M1814_003569 [Vezdaea aestivalis]
MLETRMNQPSPTAQGNMSTGSQYENSSLADEDAQSELSISPKSSLPAGWGIEAVSLQDTAKESSNRASYPAIPASSLALDQSVLIDDIYMGWIPTNDPLPRKRSLSTSDTTIVLSIEHGPGAKAARQRSGSSSNFLPLDPRPIPINSKSDTISAPPLGTFSLESTASFAPRNLRPRPATSSGRSENSLSDLSSPSLASNTTSSVKISVEAANLLMSLSHPQPPAARPIQLLVLLPFDKRKFTTEIRTLEHLYPPVQVKWIKCTKAGTFGEYKNHVRYSYFRDADVIFTFAILPSLPSIARHLAFIQLFTSGIDHIKGHEIYQKTTIPITKSTGIHGAQIAEWVFGTYISLRHNLGFYMEKQRDRMWVPILEAPIAAESSNGMVLGVFGYGCIGRHVARIGQGMGMKVHVYSRRDRKESKASQVDTFIMDPNISDPDAIIPQMWFSGEDKENLHSFLLSGINLLVLCVPLTSITKGCIGATELRLMSRKTPGDIYVSNVSRGEIIDQDALIAALKKHRRDGGITGAMLDTTSPEPLPQDSELWTMPNVIITPHISALTEGFANRAFMVLTENIKRWVRKEPLVNLVEREKGY